MRLLICPVSAALMCFASGVACAQVSMAEFEAPPNSPQNSFGLPATSSRYWEDSGYWDQSKPVSRTQDHSAQEANAAQEMSAAQEMGSVLEAADEAVGEQEVGSGVGAGVDLGQPLTIPQEGTINYGTGGNSNHCASCVSGSCDGRCAMHVTPSGWHPHLLGGTGGGWFGGVYGLIINRDDDTPGTVLGFDDSVPTTPLLSTGAVRMDAAGGFAVRFGKMLNATTALEAVYWGIFPDDVTARLANSLTPGNVNSALLFTGLDYDNGGGAQAADNFFQNTQLLEARRNFEYHNVEINLLRMPFVFTGGGQAGKRARMAILAGARYFRADDYLALAADSTGESFGDDPNNELVYNVDVENHLVGFQLGGLLDYCITRRLSGHVVSKFGIYNNHMSLDSLMRGGNGTAVVNAGPYTGQAFALDSKKDDVAFLAELDAGLDFQVSSHFRFTGGYRVVPMSGVALAPSQIPLNFTDLSSAANIDDHDTLILHGAYAGLEFLW